MLGISMQSFWCEVRLHGNASKSLPYKACESKSFLPKRSNALNSGKYIRGGISCRTEQLANAYQCCPSGETRELVLDGKRICKDMPLTPTHNGLKRERESIYLVSLSHK